MTGVGPGATVVVIPTYNEIENIDTAIASVLAALPEAHVLVVDDASPDGTGAAADRAAAADPRVHVLHRTVKDGLGGAYLAGFAWAMERGYGVVGEFDADGSHPADALPVMHRRLLEDDAVGAVVGSRWVPGGRVVDWPRRREVLSRGGNAYARWMLDLPVHDATAGFRLYRTAVLERMALDRVASKGYLFQVDLTRRALASGARVVEVPIVFRERELGTSKMSGAIVLEAMGMVTVWGVQRRLRRAAAGLRGWRRPTTHGPDARA